ncbi:Bisphosphoglycerate mutase, partial [Gryllus bimaculatus]
MQSVNGMHKTYFADGKEQAIAAAAMIKKKKFQVDVAHTSLLSRANDTLKIILEELEVPEIPIQVSWRLNPKHYGALTSWCKSEMAGKYGEEQVLLWRRSYRVPPPPMECDHEYFYEFLDDYRYKAPEQLVENIPFTETLEQVLQRLLPY